MLVFEINLEEFFNGLSIGESTKIIVALMSLQNEGISIDIKISDNGDLLLQ